MNGVIEKALEGIKITNAGGLLYAPERWSNNTISAAIRNAFYNIAWEGTELNSKYVKYVNTSDFIDFISRIMPITKNPFR